MGPTKTLKGKGMKLLTSSSGSKKRKVAKGPLKAVTAANGAPASRAAEEQLKQLRVELEVETACRKAQEAAAQTLGQELAALRLRHAGDTATADDVLQNQQREKDRLKDAARCLERRLKAESQETMVLRCQLQATAAEQPHQGGEAATSGSEVQHVLADLRQQEERVAAQEADLQHLRERLQFAEEALESERTQVADLQVAVQARSQLRFLRDSPWLAHVRLQRLTGALPSKVQPGDSLAVAGERLVLEARPAVCLQQEPQPAQEKCLAQQGQQQAAQHILDLGTGRWSAIEAAACKNGSSAVAPLAGGPSQHVTGRAVCSIHDKLLGFGGSCGGKLLAAATQFFHPKLQQWLPAPAPADLDAQQPPPPTGAALAYCPRAHAAYLFGGRGESGACLGDLWRLDCSSLAWKKLDKENNSRPTGERGRAPCLEVPPPSAAAGLAVSPDGNRLWLMGGRVDSRRCTNALHWFDLNMLYWARADEAEDSMIEPRSHHAMACLGRFVAVVGGISYAADGRVTFQQSCSLFDTAEGTWCLLDGNAFDSTAARSSEPSTAVVSMASGVVASTSQACSSSSTGGGSSSSNRGISSKHGRQYSSTPTFVGVGNCVFVGSQLFMLKASPCSSDGLLRELWNVHLQLPENIEQRRQATCQSTMVVKTLSLTQEAVGPTSTKLSWQAPTANHNKLLKFRLMMTNEEGRTREAYEGGESSCRVTGLMPHRQYIFCIKALYDDASF